MATCKDNYPMDDVECNTLGQLHSLLAMQKQYREGDMNFPTSTNVCTSLGSIELDEYILHTIVNITNGFV